MCIFFVFLSIPKNCISHCSATNARQKTVFFENLFMIGFHIGAVKTGRVTLKNLQILTGKDFKTGRVTLKNLQILTGKDFQIPAHADVKRHWIGIGSNKRHLMMLLNIMCSIDVDAVQLHCQHSVRKLG